MRFTKYEIASVLIKFEESDEPAIILANEFVDVSGRGERENISRYWNENEAYVIRNMVEIGLLRLDYVSGKPWQEGGETNIWVTVTPSGHDFLAEWRRNRWWWKFGRGICRFVEGVFQSIVTPVVVAALTVLVMKYFGISKD